MLAQTLTVQGIRLVAVQVAVPGQLVHVLPGGEALGAEGEVGTMVWASEAEGAEERARLLGVSMAPEEQLGEDARNRLEFRAGMLLEDLAEQALQPRP